MYLSAGISGVCLRKDKQGESDHGKACITGRRRIKGKYQIQKREAADF